MSDSLNTLLQQRFQGHEAPVDPGVWAGIQQQLTTAAPASDAVDGFFKERFQGHEVPVDPAVWANISSQLGHTATAGTVAGTAWGWVAAGAVVVVAAAAFIMVGPEDAAPIVAVNETVQTVVPPVQEETLAPRAESAAVRVLEPERPRQAAAVEQRPAQPPASRTTHTASSQHPAAVGATTPSASGQSAPSLPEGATLVSDIITDLEEQVWHQPVTAQPEPGLPSVPAMAGKADHVVAAPAPEAQATASAPLPKLFMPNTFTPNGDGINDTYTVDGDGYQAILIRVFSMKNNALVFTTNSGEPWSGDGCDDGMYMVAVEAHTPDGRTSTQGQVVWLNRSRMN